MKFKKKVFSTLIGHILNIHFLFYFIFVSISLKFILHYNFKAINIKYALFNLKINI